MRVQKHPCRRGRSILRVVYDGLDQRLGASRADGSYQQVARARSLMRSDGRQVAMGDAVRRAGSQSHGRQPNRPDAQAWSTVA